MITVRTPVEKLEALTWPELVLVDKFSLAPDDCLVVCAGFEDRALAVLKSAVCASGSFHVVLILYRPYLEENREEEFREVCRNGEIQVACIDYDSQNPAGLGAQLLAVLAPCGGRVFVDISAMSRLLITQALVALGSREVGFAHCYVAYVEAEIYPPSKEDAESELAKLDSDPTSSIQFLSSGVFGITVVPELSALALAGAQSRLIAFPSLDEHHLIALQAELQPSRFSFIEGVPPGRQNQWRQDFIARVNHLEEIRESAGERFKSSTLDYRETLDCLVSLYKRHAIRERLLLAPTGSKMQTVAVGIFRALVQDVQIVYPTPRGFRKPDDYTHGVGNLRCLSLGPFVVKE